MIISHNLAQVVSESCCDDQTSCDHSQVSYLSPLWLGWVWAFYDYEAPVTIYTSFLILPKRAERLAKELVGRAARPTRYITLIHLLFLNIFFPKINPRINSQVCKSHHISTFRRKTVITLPILFHHCFRTCKQHQLYHNTHFFHSLLFQARHKNHARFWASCSHVRPPTCCGSNLRHYLKRNHFQDNKLQGTAFDSPFYNASMMSSVRWISSGYNLLRKMSKQNILEGGIRTVPGANSCWIMSSWRIATILWFTAIAKAKRFKKYRHQNSSVKVCR